MMRVQDLLDHRSIDWTGVVRTSYLVHQTLRYEYPGPIHNLQQRLVVVPADHHGPQRLVEHQLDVSAPSSRVQCAHDRFGNRVYTLYVPTVEESVTFEIGMHVDWIAGAAPARCAPDDLPVYAEATALTSPDSTLGQAAERLIAGGAGGSALAEAIMNWVYGALSYVPDVTGVRTTAAEALALGKGVCQDYAHVMLALCRLCGLPARYVSGHLLGEGGTHAWVEVLLPDVNEAGTMVALALDPTHNRHASPTYITVAVGRDYRDVAPTSGTFSAPYGGRLTSRKRAGLTALHRDDGAAA